ncbi:hypothetical protein ILP92_03670 [Maribius pontilimi]|uniref:Regulator RcnB of Ni and Co efflux n=1 Tax=Palleronia pontilimi TaxID=1964209 RepID=A0A934IFI9_9RHOB|nr:hypothetical protein [Palleronia pontilimi]MBJ3761846.1 hypothetical protein [Palleronia pontilimi]
MNRIVTATLALALAAAPALAGNHKSNGHKGNGGNKHGNFQAAQGCPPGLAKKSPACVPPGLAKKGVRRDYRIGDTLDRDFDRWRDYERYGVRLNDGERFYRRDDMIYRVQRDSREILDILRLADLVLN